MQKIITQRTAQDGYHANLVAQGMENAGADVFAITNDCNGSVQIYCKHDKSVSSTKIDMEISEEVKAKAECYMAF